MPRGAGAPALVVVALGAAVLAGGAAAGAAGCVGAAGSAVGGATAGAGVSAGEGRGSPCPSRSQLRSFSPQSFHGASCFLL